MGTETCRSYVREEKTVAFYVLINCAFVGKKEFHQNSI
jgi:hypothetical protein